MAALPGLTVLNLYHLEWEEDTEVGLAWLVACLPRLRILNAPDRVLVRQHRLPDVLPRTVTNVLMLMVVTVITPRRCCLQTDLRASTSKAMMSEAPCRAASCALPDDL